MYIPTSHSELVGTTIRIVVRLEFHSTPASAIRTEAMMMPTKKTTKAVGTALLLAVIRQKVSVIPAIKYPSHCTQLSFVHVGLTASGNMRRPFLNMLSPKPICNPLTTGLGIIASKVVIKFVKPKNATIIEVAMPAAIISPSVKPSVNATVAILFIG